MRSKIEFNALGIVFLLTTLFLLEFSAMATEDEQSETIRGTVVKTHGQDGGEIVVAIQVVPRPEDQENEAEADSGDYVVANNEKGIELAKSVGKEVEATGIIKTGKDGARTIFVTAFTLVEPDDESSSGDNESPEND